MKNVKRPNILYIFTDQQCSEAMSCAGNEDLHTPAIDSLAAHGTVFKNAYCTYPLCTPSRASMFTGRMPHEVGADGNDKEIAERFRKSEMGHLFRDAGYETAYAGKWHVPQYNMPDGHGFEVIAGFGDEQTTQKSMEFLKRKHDKPFLLVISLNNPHEICEWARAQYIGENPANAVNTTDCPSLPGNYCIPPYEPQAIREETNSRPQVHANNDFVDINWWRHYRYAYYRYVEQVDEKIGQILDTLRQQGLEDNTLIIFSSDHGDMNGAHQLSQKLCLYEESVKVPFIVSYNGVTQPGFVNNEHLVSAGLDLLPTLCDYAGIPMEYGLKGSSIRSLAEGKKTDCLREQIIIETTLPKTNAKGRAVRTSRYKYVIYEWGRFREQLFDLENDPGEMVNLALSSKYQAILDEHRERMAVWVRETEDSFKWLIPPGYRTAL